MAQRKHVNAKIDLEGLPKEIVAGVIVAQMYQAKGDVETNPDSGARERIITAADPVLKLLEGYTTPEVVKAIPQIQAILGGV